MASFADAPRVRPFATSVRDLDLDFAQDDRPQLTGAVLRCCVESPAERLDAATLDRRVRALLRIVRETQGDRLLWKTRCANADCGHEMELELSVSQLLSAPEPAECFSWSAEPGCELELRLPTGRDQIEWRESAADANEEEGVDLRMASSLVSRVNGQPPASDWTLPPDWLPALDAAFREHDVLTAMELQVSCPWCGKESALEPDVEALALSRLAAEQRRVLEEIHQLASAYHWTEADVLALPRLRRSFYIARTGGEALP
ncbi:MAG TPA: hypothetical protein VEV20_03440 [Burkholderiales bacterium]|nr:hypothetical protein [Burkholderiales bacterium]